MTAREFAAAIKRPYPTVALWLRNGLVPDVEVIELGTAKLWQIPVSAVETFIQPKRGRPLKIKSLADRQADNLAEADAPEKKPTKKRAMEKATAKASKR